MGGREKLFFNSLRKGRDSLPIFLPNGHSDYFRIRENKLQSTIIINVNNNKRCFFIEIKHRKNETLQGYWIRVSSIMKLFVKNKIILKFRMTISKNLSFIKNTEFVYYLSTWQSMTTHLLLISNKIFQNVFYYS